MNLAKWIELCSPAANNPTLDRRQMLLSGVAAAAFVSAAAPLVLAQTPGERLTELFDSFMNANLDASPEGTTSLGLDTGARVLAKSNLDDRALVFIATEKNRVSDQLKQMLAFDRAPLSGMDRVNYDVVLF